MIKKQTAFSFWLWASIWTVTSFLFIIAFVILGKVVHVDRVEEMVRIFFIIIFFCALMAVVIDNLRSIKAKMGTAVQFGLVLLGLAGLGLFMSPWITFDVISAPSIVDFVITFFTVSCSIYYIRLFETARRIKVIKPISASTILALMFFFNFYFWTS